MTARRRSQSAFDPFRSVLRHPAVIIAYGDDIFMLNNIFSSLVPRRRLLWSHFLRVTLDLLRILLSQVHCYL